MSGLGKPKTKITGQGQVSVPAQIRQRLGVGPGSYLEWEMDGTQAIVRKSGDITFDEIHRALFPDGPPKPISVEEMDEAIEEYMRKHHARR